MSFPTVEQFHPDAPALQCLSEILGRGKGSYLYQNLVASQKAIQASASHSSDELAGELFMFVLPYPGKSLSEFESELREALLSFESNGVSDEDLIKFKARYESNFIHGLEKVSGKVSKLAYYETFAAPDETPARPDNFTIKPKTYIVTEEETELPYVKAKDDFDRSIKPKAKTAKLVKPPSYWSDQLDHGIRVIGAENKELPTIAFNIRLKGGYILDSLNKEQIGLAALTAEMLNTSTLQFTEKEIAEELEKLGSQIQINASSQYFEISVNSLSKHFDATLDLLKEKLFQPKFEEEDFKRIQTQTIESALSSTKSASSIASSVYDKLLYGEDHLFGLTDTQYIPAIEKLSAADAKQFYQNHFSIKNANIVVVGDISQKQFLEKISFINSFRAEENPKVSLAKTPKPTDTTIYFVDKPISAQSEIRIGYLSDLTFDATGDYFKRQLTNFTLGGAFNSRINLNLREDKGVTYGARSWFEASELPGPFTVSTSVKKDSTILAINEILSELNTFRSSPITDKELAFLKQAIGQRDALKYESNRQKSSFLAKLQRFNIKPGFTDLQKQITSEITQDDILNLAKKHLPLEKMAILLVGDKTQFEEELPSFGYPIIELDSSGNRIIREQ